MVDWLYVNTLGISSPTDLAKMSQEEIQEYRLRIYGYDPTKGRKISTPGKN
jgi:hypothetical protein